MNDKETETAKALKEMYDLGYKHGYDAGRLKELNAQIAELKTELGVA